MGLRWFEKGGRNAMATAERRSAGDGDGDGDGERRVTATAREECRRPRR